MKNLKHHLILTMLKGTMIWFLFVFILMITNILSPILYPIEDWINGGSYTRYWQVDMFAAFVEAMFVMWLYFPERNYRD